MKTKGKTQNNVFKQCKKCGSANIILVEYSWDNPEHYDGISEIDCQDCGARIGRWSGKELQKGECELKYGGESNE